MKIVNPLGEIVQLTCIENNKNQLNIKDLKCGVYFLQIVADNRLIGVSKIIKE